LSRTFLSTGVVDGKIYAIGGTNQKNGVNDYTALQTVEEYDPAKDKWTNKPDMPTARGGCAAAVMNGGIYLFGGGNRQELNPTVEEYDPATDSWTQKTDIPTPRVWPSANVVKGKIYVIGGANWTRVGLSTVEEYTPEGLGKSVSPTGKLPTKWGELRTEGIVGFSQIP
jgi:N-acetylneuraminic acid mutarotase